jgi:hypothetical protein
MFALTVVVLTSTVLTSTVPISTVLTLIACPLMLLRFRSKALA